MDCDISKGFLNSCTNNLSVYIREENTYILVKFQGGGVNRPKKQTSTKERDPNKSYFEGINNIES